MNRIGPRMADVQAFVAHNPGLYMRAAAEYVAPGNGRGLGWGYKTVHRAIRAGLVLYTAEPGGRKRLYPRETP